MGEEFVSEAPAAEGQDGNRRRRRRRRRRGGATKNGPRPESGEELIEGEAVVAVRSRKGRRQAVDISGPALTLPASGRNPHKKRSSRTKRASPGSVSGRKRRLSRLEMDDLAEWLQEMPEHLVATLYRGLGGQPGRVADHERMIQLAVRAIAQGSRLATLLKQMHERDRKALAVLLQCGGVAHADEFHRELSLTLGGHEREWKRTLNVLAERGVVMASDEQDGAFFYVIPPPLVDGLLAELESEMTLPTFTHEDMRVMDHRPFQPPLDFSITTLATYAGQRSIRLTQRHDIYRTHQEEMNEFFSQLWEAESDLFRFHLNFLMMHQMVELRGEYLSLNRDVMEEWLQLESEDQRDLIFRALDEHFDMSEWVLWAVNAAEADWVAERPLVALYRHWKRGKDWRDRFTRGVYASPRSHERDSFSFAPLVNCGLLEMGQWGQEKFYRLSNRGDALLNPDDDEGFRQFYLTPSFEMMAPAGLAPVLLFRMGELGELVGCDRANTYRITQLSIESALENGWRREDVLQFLRENSQIGLPENVEATLKDWIGNRGDVEFHDLMMLTVHRSQIRRFEGNKRVKPFILHRFAPGMYAVDRTRRDEVHEVLAECGFAPSKDVRAYPGDPEQVEARAGLHRMLVQAREDTVNPSNAAGPDFVSASRLRAVPGSKSAGKKSKSTKGIDQPPLVNSAEVRTIIDQAMAQNVHMDMVYLAKNGQRIACEVEPQRLAFKGSAPVLVGLDCGEDERRSYVLERIERLRIREET